MQVNIKALNERAKIPVYAHSTDAGLDLTATSKYTDSNGNICYGTGLAMEIPEGYVGLIYPRSSISSKELALSNCVGVIDSGYRGEITFKFRHQREFIQLDTLWNRLKAFFFGIDAVKHGFLEVLNPRFGEYNVGERIGQIIIMPYPHIDFVEVDNLADSERGTGGYGSTGK